MDENQFGPSPFTQQGTSGFTDPQASDYPLTYSFFTSGPYSGDDSGIDMYLNIPNRTSSPSNALESPPSCTANDHFHFINPDWPDLIPNFHPVSPTGTVPERLNGGTSQGVVDIKSGSPPPHMTAPFEPISEGHPHSQPPMAGNFTPSFMPHDALYAYSPMSLPPRPPSTHQPMQTPTRTSGPTHPSHAYTTPPPSNTRRRPSVASPTKRVFAEVEDPQGGCSPQPAKKRIIKPQISIKLDTNEDFEIKKESEKSPTGNFQGMFGSIEMARQKRNRLLDMYRKPRDCCTFPAEDATFPGTDAEMLLVVKRLFDAINDWSDFREWSQALKSDMRNQVIEGLRQSILVGDGVDPAARPGDVPVDELRPSPDKLVELLPPLHTQQKRILGRVLNDQMVEWLCWELAEAAIQSQQGFTQIPHWCGADGA
ncbi:hypothetical protein PT974_02276 [Cladobotryum mycophilum]|uniref:Uncharacterized protein n=1 Tax=Cladobotryum mycophilum TaxID=491253 RepID=A0ABR0SXR3_9HYPO